MDNAIYSYYEELGLEGSGSEWSAGALQSRDLARPQARSPTTGTTSSQASYRLRRLFMLRIKSHLALTPLRLLYYNKFWM